MKFSGLTDREVEHSRQQYGSNAIPDSQPTTFWEAFKETFGDPMIRILLIIAGLMIVMWVLGYADIYEPAGTIVAVLIVAFVSAKTSVASDTKYRELKGSTKKDQCKVYRNGVITVLDVEDVVVGDKILLQSGDKIPADGVLLSGSLRVDNSALNGEAEECKKEAADGSTAFPEDITGDTFVDEHSLFRGAVVFDGEGVLDVRKVGLKTMMGKMAEEMQEDEPDSPLKVKLGKLANQISRFGYIGAVVIAVLYLVHFVILAGGASAFFAMGFEAVFTKIVEAVSLAVVIIVCAVPEGLPLMISLVLMQNTSKMLDHNVLVRKAEGIETAGSLNILFSDKTGTITKGSLEVVEFFTADGKTIPIDELSRHSKVKGYVDLAIGKNTQAMFDSRHQVIGGNATDQALMKFIGENTFRAFQEDKDCQVTAFQGFNSKNKFSQARVESFGKTFYKGAPERLLAKAEKYLDAEGTVCPLDHAALNAKIDELAAKAMRVLAFGYSGRELKENEIQDDVVLIGLVGIRDDVRSEAKEAIREVQEAGIQVVMITGDRLETAVAIAKDAGLLQNPEDKAISSAQLNKMSDEEVKRMIPHIRVIARALPTDKSRMVRLCQEMNLVVGMTGDGVNDVLALKEADCSIAMASGSEAASNAAQIVLLDSDFARMPSVVLEGRRVVNNIQRSASLFLVKNLFSMLMTLFTFVAVSKYPLYPTQLSFLGTFTIGTPAFLLAMQPDKSRIEGHFLTNVVLLALPAALTDFILLAVLTVAGNCAGIGHEQLSTMCIMILLAVGMAALIRICMPLDKIRAGICILMASGAVFSVLFLKPLFALYPLSPVWVMVTGILMAAAVPVFAVMCRLVLLQVQRHAKHSKKFRERLGRHFKS